MEQWIICLHIAKTRQVMACLLIIVVCDQLWSNPDHFHISIPPFKMGTIQLITHWQKDAPRKLLNGTEQKRALRAPENKKSGLKNHTKQNKTKQKYREQRMQQEIGLKYYGSWTWDLDEPWQSGPWEREEKTITHKILKTWNTSTQKQNRNQKKRTVWHEKTGILELSNIWTCVKCKMQKQLGGGGKDKSTWTQDLELFSIKKPDTRTHLPEHCL